ECCGGTFILQDRTIFLCTFLKNEKNERGFKKSVTLTFWTAPLLSILVSEKRLFTPVNVFNPSLIILIGICS
ncbi:hypothetical protein, partial [Anoxybacteroides rupiense]|uniref:hypothetical protein n=1 Tax=Anoxybacteroides rupiense TaxID=311460 RepID=UPI00366C9788